MTDATNRLETAVRRSPDSAISLRCRALRLEAMLLMRQGKFRAALHVLDEAVALSRASGDPELLGETLVDQASVQIAMGGSELLRAEIALHEALAMFERAGDDWDIDIARIHLTLEEAVDEAGRPTAAMGALPTPQRDDPLRYPVSSAFPMLMASYALGLRGDREAWTVLAAGLERCYELDERHMVASAFDLAAWLFRHDRPRIAAGFVGAANDLRLAGYERTPWESWIYEDAVGQIKSRMSLAQLQSAESVGASWTVETAVQRVLTALADPDNHEDGWDTGDEVAPELTDRELEILGLLADGLSTDRIAETIFVSPGTVKVDIRSIYRKLGTNNRAEAMALAIERGLIQ